MELTNYFLTELNDYNINSLNALIKMYKEEKVRLFNIPIKIENANELLIELDKLIMVYEKLIETLENITIDDTNRFNISKILRKMLKDKLITKAFFFNDVSEDIFFKVWDKVFKGFRNETK
jgi:hypothetical protein